ncbi:MAG: hypothetical protein ACR2PZ_13325 [Pseudomonadales bacterium]
MMEYGMAWMVVTGAGLLALAFWLLITRNIRNAFLRTLLRCLAAVWMLLPAPVPNYPGQYAPAYVVALFESAFQGDGEPNTAFAILIGGSVFVLVLLIAWAMLGKFNAATDAPEADSAALPRQ